MNFNPICLERRERSGQRKRHGEEEVLEESSNEGTLKKTKCRECSMCMCDKKACSCGQPEKEMRDMLGGHTGWCSEHALHLMSVS